MDRSTLLKALEQLLTSEDVAELTGYPINYVSLYVKRGKLPQPIGKLGRFHVWDREEILEWIKKNPPRKKTKE